MPNMTSDLLIKKVPWRDVKGLGAQDRIHNPSFRLQNVEQHTGASLADMILPQRRQEDFPLQQPCIITKNKDQSCPRRIAFCSNTRADWAKLEPLATILADNGFVVDIFVIGMHMVEEYGSTYLDIVKYQQFGVFTRTTWAPGDSEIETAIATMRATAQLLQQYNYDLLIVHGDRLEAKAAADAAHLVGCRLAHVEGGDLTGGDDNKNRYAITAIADHHFPSSQAAAERLVSCGQKAVTVFPIGSPDLDVFHRPNRTTIDHVLDKYRIPFQDFGVAPFHSNSAESKAASKQAKDFYETLMISGRKFVIPRPNNDKGTEGVQQALDALPKDRVCVIPNFEFYDYVVLLKAAGCVAGNSSIVVTSALAIGKLCLNIGNRQQGRTPPTDGLFNYSPHDRQGILDCLEANWGKTYRGNTLYGDGHAAQRFFETLSNREFWYVPRQKLLFNQKHVG